MTISDNIFNLLKERKMSQKEFAKRTDIAESTISDWKRKRTNPVSDKILTICEVLDVTPYELLSGTESEGERGRRSECITIEKSSELGQFLLEFQAMDERSRNRLLGYMNALKELKSE